MKIQKTNLSGYSESNPRRPLLIPKRRDLGLKESVVVAGIDKETSGDLGDILCVSLFKLKHLSVGKNLFCFHLHMSFY